jgi:hypothetical protein
MFSFEAEGFSCGLEVLYGDPNYGSEISESGYETLLGWKQTICVVSQTWMKTFSVRLRFRPMWFRTSSSSPLTSGSRPPPILSSLRRSSGIVRPDYAT